MSGRVPPSSKSVAVQVDNAKRLYKRFTGHEAEVIGKVGIADMPDAVVRIGDIDAIEYTTIRDGVVEKYRHRFHKNSRPLFVVSPDGSQLFIVGGRYNFTERGIVDTDEKNRAIE